jgi:hypothetical protein
MAKIPHPILLKIVFLSSDKGDSGRISFLEMKNLMDRYNFPGI